MKGSQIPFKKNYILGASMILAAFVLGLMLVWTVRTLKSFDDTVTVRGLCEREVPADRVVLRVSYTAQSNSLEDLRSTVENNDRIIIERQSAFSAPRWTLCANCRTLSMGSC